MDLTKKSKSFMISDILTEPLTNPSDDENTESSSSDNRTHVDRKVRKLPQILQDNSQKSGKSTGVCHSNQNGPHSDRASSTHSQLPRPFPWFDFRQDNLCNQLLVQGCGPLAGSSFYDSSGFPSKPVGFPAGPPVSSADHKQQCFCLSPFCGTRGNAGGDPLGLMTSDTCPMAVPMPLYVRTRFTNATELLKSKRCRRSRTVFSELQLMGLERKFQSQKYLSTPDRVELAERLGLSQIQVKTWYQNRRMKWKKQVMSSGGTEPPTKPKGRPKKSFLEEAATQAQERNSPAEGSTATTNTTLLTNAHVREETDSSEPSHAVSPSGGDIVYYATETDSDSDCEIHEV